MPEPSYSATTERLYGRLPDFMRAADSRNDWIMKRWISSIADSQGEVDVLLSRIDYWPVPHGGDPADTSDLVDARTADAEWLDWLGQLFGVRLYPGMTITERRDAVAFASSGFRAGTKVGMADAAKSTLVGGRYAAVYDHSSYNVGDGGQWDVLVVTRSSETPDPTRVLRSIVRKRAKPAGVLLWHRSYGTSWDVLEVTYPTWNDWDATQDWNEIEEVGLATIAESGYGAGIYGDGPFGGGAAIGPSPTGPADVSTATHVRGINAAGGEFGRRETWARFDSDASFAYYAQRGHYLVRIPFAWENLQPTLGGALDLTYLDALRAAVQSCTSRGMIALLDCHNYCRYLDADKITTHVLGGGLLTEAHHADLWTRLATEFASNSLVQFGLMNEPHDLLPVAGSFTPTATVYGFEASLEGWGVEDAATVTLAHNITASQVHDGTGAMKVTRSGLTNTAGQVTRINDAGANTRVSTDGKTWRIWVRVSGNANGSWRGQIMVQDDTFNWHYGPETSLPPGSGNWVELEYTPPDTLWAQAPNAVGLQIIVDNPTVTSANIYVDTMRQGAVTGTKTDAQVWESCAQAMVTAVRNAGANNYLRIAGYHWSGARRFWDTHPTWWITDPAGRSGPEGHYYPDPDSNGVYDETFAAATTDAQAKGYASVAERAVAEIGQFIDGCVTRNLRGLIGEVGWPNDVSTADWNAVGEAIYGRCDASTVPMDVTVWAAGEQWGTTYDLSVYTGTPQSTATSIALVVEAHPTVFP